MHLMHIGLGAAALARGRLHAHARTPPARTCAPASRKRLTGLTFLETGIAGRLCGATSLKFGIALGFAAGVLQQVAKDFPDNPSISGKTG
jgi:hypothetical protein